MIRIRSEDHKRLSLLQWYQEWARKPCCPCPMSMPQVIGKEDQTLTFRQWSEEYNITTATMLLVPVVIRVTSEDHIFFCDMQINNSSHADRASSDQDHKGRSYPHLSSFVTCRSTTIARLTVLPVISITNEDYFLISLLLWHTDQRQQPYWPCLQWSGLWMKIMFSFLFFCDMQINDRSHAARASNDQDH